MIRTERKYIEILRILKEHKDPMGAKRLSELMTERGFILSDRAVQYYLSYLDTMGFTEKVGNQGRILTAAGMKETDNALVDDRIGFVISKLERLAYRSTFDPATSTGDVAYNLSIVPEESAEKVKSAFDEVVRSGCGFFNSYRIIDHDPRVPRARSGSSPCAASPWMAYSSEKASPSGWRLAEDLRLKTASPGSSGISSPTAGQPLIHWNSSYRPVSLPYPVLPGQKPVLLLQTSDKYRVPPKNTWRRLSA